MPLVRRAGAVLALLAGTSLLAPAPAFAGPPQETAPAAELTVPENAYLLKRGVSPTGGTRIWLDPQPAEGRASQAGVTLEVDASDLDGIVQLRTRRACGDHAFGDTLTLTCDLGTLTAGKRNVVDAVYIEAVHGVKRGSHGEIRYTFSAPGAKDVTYTSELSIEGPDLRPRIEPLHDGLKPGAPHRFKPRLFNAGRSTARGFGVTFAGATHFSFPAQYRNCRTSGHAMNCWFDQELEPGTAYEFADPVTVDVPEHVMTSEFTYKPYLPGLVGEEVNGMNGDPGLQQWRTGSGPELKVRRIEAPAQTFTDRFNLGKVTVRTTQTSDLQVSADPVVGTTGSTATAEFRVHNAGPGRMTRTALRIAVPEGLSVIEPTPPPDPDNELEWEWECVVNAPGEVICNPDRALDPGDSWQTSLEFRIDRRVRDAKGLLQVVHSPERPANDVKPADNTAPIEVRATGGPLVEPTQAAPTPLPTTTASPSAVPVPAAAGTEAERTGKTGPAVAVAAVLLAAGGSGFLIRRVRARRRAHQ
ncbi:hypothetical protein ACIBI4_17905 [Streptomyces sp. NPDC050418]|uniref:hypothetical protein n=1 Tax=Streptomyces sp. NPDC050418 TaxID=3365612 RepID=UPI0037BD13BD